MSEEIKHAVAFIKRQAKKIKKAEGVTHTQALDVAAIRHGFDSYKAFLNSTK